MEQREPSSILERGKVGALSLSPVTTIQLRVLLFHLVFGLFIIIQSLALGYH